MASRAVIGTTAVAAGLYWANEKYQEHLVETEREEAEQRYQDRLEDMARKAQEESMYRYRQPNKIEGTQMGASIAFAMAVHRIVKEMLVDVVEEVKKEAARSSPRVTGTGSLHLPLLETEHNSPDEIALAASLVFGNAAVVERALKASIIEPGPGTALSKLTPRSVSLLKNVFGRELRTEISVGENTANVSDIGSEALKAFVSMIVFDDGRHPTSTRPRFLRKLELKGSKSYQEFIALKRCSEAFGVYVHPSGFWSEPRASSRGIEFSYKYKGKLTDIESAAPDFMPDPSSVAEVWSTNFRGCTFYVPKKHLLFDFRGGVEFNLSNIELLGSRGKSRGRGKARAASKPLDVDDLDLAQRIVARNLAMDVVARAMSLLDSFGPAKVSLEHLAV